MPPRAPLAVRLFSGIGLMLSDVAGRCLEGVRSRAYASTLSLDRRADPPGAPMTTWEYLTTPLLIHNTAAILNNWGKQGGSSSRS